MKNKKIIIGVVAALAIVIVSILIFRVEPNFEMSQHKLDEQGNYVFTVNNKSEQSYFYFTFDEKSLYNIEEKVGDEWLQKNLAFTNQSSDIKVIEEGQSVDLVVNKAHLSDKEFRVVFDYIKSIELSSFDSLMSKFFGVSPFKQVKSEGITIQ